MQRISALLLALVPACAPSTSASPAASPDAPAAAPTAAPAAAPAIPCLEDDEKGCTAKCDAGDLESCTRLARIYAFGNANTPESLDKARSLQAKGCAANHGKACYFLASAYELGRGAPKDPARAQALIAKAAPLVTAACDGGDAESCSLLADMHLVGKGVPRSEAKETALRKRATALYGKECDAGDASACSMYGGDLVSAKDNAGAAKALTRGCDGGDAGSCNLLAGLYDEGVGVPMDHGKAQALWGKACKAGIAAACSRGRRR